MSAINQVHSSNYHKSFYESTYLAKKHSASGTNFAENLSDSLNEKEKIFFKTGVLSLEESTMLNKTYSASIKDDYV